ncbi:Glucosamine-6-phosphate deaminase 1 [Arenibacter antarcticus]|uniref:Galactosamine-6-phosphate isomerase n=1 Tax=Arenibacter antarcticus TaxID=2040469 RepID=A0ABW5VFU6_9FLAO|nr:galactosamine-6-phosphate isomerase [Arenibacter sp. H213]MCM4168133.1 galactosamine-6-phosphate isomerase [Arenibacter sp. H213]
MKIESFTNSNLLSKKAANLIFSTLIKKPDSLICTASGNSTVKTYQTLTERSIDNPEIFGKLNILKLDEWGGIEMDHPNSCETFLQKMLIEPLKISSSKYISFNSNPIDKKEECERISNLVKKKGPIDLCILGLGINGHIAFNEPGNYLNPGCHIATLSKSSLKHSMAVKAHPKPSFGLTIGMGDILQSKQILILLTGPDKSKIAKEFLSQKITTQLPASFLWLHANTTCLINEEDIHIK